MVDAHHHGVAIECASDAVTCLYEGVGKVARVGNCAIGVGHRGVVEIATDNDVAVRVIGNKLCDSVGLECARHGGTCDFASHV